LTTEESMDIHADLASYGTGRTWSEMPFNEETVAFLDLEQQFQRQTEAFQTQLRQQMREMHVLKRWLKAAVFLMVLVLFSIVCVLLADRYMQPRGKQPEKKGEVRKTDFEELEKKYLRQKHGLDENGKEYKRRKLDLDELAKTYEMQKSDVEELKKSIDLQWSTFTIEKLDDQRNGVTRVNLAELEQDYGRRMLDLEELGKKQERQKLDAEELGNQYESQRLAFHELEEQYEKQKLDFEQLEKREAEV